MSASQPPPLRRIVSGGQTGVDRGALDAAIALEIEHGGWCPRGRLAEDGRIPGKYRLAETSSPEYPARTEQNVIDSDATLILFRGTLRGGSRLTHHLAKKHCKPCFTVNLDQPVDTKDVAAWLHKHHVETLNIAGPRESSDTGIAQQAFDVMIRLIKQTAGCE